MPGLQGRCGDVSHFAFYNRPPQSTRIWAAAGSQDVLIVPPKVMAGFLSASGIREDGYFSEAESALLLVRFK
jgi:hypothetical protein